MRGLFRTVGVAVALALPATALAGMPAPLPTNVSTVLQLNESPLLRLQVISFFLLAFFLSALALKVAWNWLRKDFTALPRLTYLKALMATLLIGLLFVIVLTMISGARELMTPGAWKKDGITYKLAEEPKPEPEAVNTTARREQLIRIHIALLQFAATHQGRFPNKEEAAAFAPGTWDIPGTSGLKFIYIAGRSATDGKRLLAVEPEWRTDRWGLRVNGEVVPLRTSEIQSELAGEGKP